MADVTFLGVENPLGMLGLKIKGVVEKEDALDPLKHVKKETHDVSTYAVFTQDQKYTNRAKIIPKQIQQGLVDDTITNRDYVLQLLAKRGKYPDLRVAMSSSLTSLLKYLRKYCDANDEDLIETIIIFGHGAEGSINLGLGPYLILPYAPPADKDHQQIKRQRQVLGLDEDIINDATKKPEPRRIRDLSTENMNDWPGLFAAIANAKKFGNSNSGYFHLFLMGCDVGKQNKTSTLQRAAATALRKIIKLAVCVSAPTATITEDHLDYLLDNIDTIRNDCAMEKKVFLKPNGAPMVELVSVGVD
jgi:hypothetical protein